jgi:hypothetical protein
VSSGNPNARAIMIQKQIIMQENKSTLQNLISTVEQTPDKELCRLDAVADLANVVPFNLALDILNLLKLVA